MGKVYITGHRNPDLDSLCAAGSYARLKNMIDPENEYVAVHCSPVSDSVRKQMEAFELEIPVYMKDVYPKVGDVVLKAESHNEASDPIYDLVKTYSTDKPSVVPIYKNGEFMDLLSVDDITAWFLNDNAEEIPVYDLTCANIEKVLPGKLVHKGKSEEFKGSILVGAATIESFDHILGEVDSAIIVTGLREEHIRHAMKRQVPAIVITTVDEAPDLDYSGYDGSVFITTLGTAETVRRIRMAEAISNMMGQPAGKVQLDDRFDDAKDIFATSHTRGLAVMDGDEYAGFVTRRCFLNVPSYSVIMVDHNEPGQSIKGIETASVVEIIDHHRLDSVSTGVPIFIDAEPLGSTCTIVYQQYIRHGIMPDAYAAKMMLTGIISDTLILRSPTTTAQDIMTVEMLAKLAKISSVDEFGEKLFSVTDNLETSDPDKMIQSDFKEYESAGVKVGIGQCEVMTLKNVGDYAADYIAALNDLSEKKGLDWTMLMVTDVLREKSVLLTSAYKSNKDLPYKKMGKQIYDMPGVMSRKKQLLPTIISITGR